MAATPTASPFTGPVLFFDGECGLCHRIVRLLLRLDRRGVLRFAPLQGPTAQTYLRSHQLPLTDFDSLVYVPNWSARDRREFLLRTDGVVAALRAVGGASGTILAWIRFMPVRWRDALYRLVARWRYRIFGQWQPRTLPRSEWQARFFE